MSLWDLRASVAGFNQANGGGAEQGARSPTPEEHFERLKRVG